MIKFKRSLSITSVKIYNKYNFRDRLRYYRLVEVYLNVNYLVTLPFISLYSLQ